MNLLRKVDLAPKKNFLEYASKWTLLNLIFID